MLIKRKCKLIYIVGLILAAMLTSSCDQTVVPNDLATEYADLPQEFTIVETTSGYCLFVHEITDVMYMKDYPEGDITLLVDSDGSPLLYEDYLKKINK